MSSESSNSHSNPGIDRLDNLLWRFVGIALLVLIFVNFVRCSSFDAFVNLESSELNLEFAGGNQTELILIEFDEDTVILDAEQSDLNLIGAAIDQISTLTRGVTLKFASVDTEQAQVCLGTGHYVLATRRDDQFDDLFLKVPGGNEYCMLLRLSGSILAFPKAVSVVPRRDSKGVIVYPRLSGSLRVRITGKEIEFISGMSLRLAIEADTGTAGGQQIEAIRVNFFDGNFGIHTWKKTSVMLAEGSKLKHYDFTPLEAMKKIMEENGLWYTLMFVIGAVLTFRKVLSLR